MSNKYSNPCIRCGKERIVAETSKEQVGASVVETILTVCPDPECQKIVERENQKAHERKLEIKRKSEERAEARRAEKAKRKSA